MATRMQQRRGTASQWVSSNNGDGPILNAGEIGWESDTNKFKIGDGVTYWDDLTYFVDATDVVAAALGGYLEQSDVGAISGVAGLDATKNLVVPGTSIHIEGATANEHETTLTVTDPTTDRTITFQDATGTVVLRDSTDTLTNKSISLETNTVTSTLAQLNTAVTDADVASLAGTETLTNKTLTSPVIATVVNGAATITMPTTTGTVALTADISAATGGSVSETGTQTLTNKSMSFGSNTFTSTLAQLNTAITDADVASLASPTFTGTPTLPTGTIATTQTAADNSTAIATTAFVGTAVANLVDSAPATLNTLNELADALGDDANFAATTATNLGLKAPLASPTFTGTVTIPAGASISGFAPLASPTFTGTVTFTGATVVGISSYNAPTLGSTSIASGATVTTISGLTDILINGVGSVKDELTLILMGAL